MAEFVIAIVLGIAAVSMAVVGAIRHKGKASGRYPYQPISDEAAARIFERAAKEAARRNEALSNPDDDYDAAVDRAVRIGRQKAGIDSDSGPATSDK